MVESGELRLTLVSASPRRGELLKTLAVPFDVCPSQVSERWKAADPAELATRNARRKVERSPLYGDRSRLLLGADTIISTNSLILGKAAGPNSARRMLQTLSGIEHQVITGVCFSGPTLHSDSLEVATDAAVSTVTFREISIWEIRDYLASGEWEDKAGAYAIQGTAGKFVARLEGEFDNVVGLPVQLIRDLIGQKFLHYRLR